MIFEKFQFCSKMSSIFLNTKSYWKSKISKKCFFKIFSEFFRFSQWIFYEFQTFLMFWKVEVQLFPKSIMSIYEICSPSSLHGFFWKTALSNLVANIWPVLLNLKKNTAMCCCSVLVQRQLNNDDRKRPSRNYCPTSI